MSNWTKLKVAELKAELKRRGLTQAGLKAELVARLEADDDEASQAGDGQQQAEKPDESANQEAPVLPDARASSDDGPEPATQRTDGNNIRPEADKAHEPVESERKSAVAGNGNELLAAAHNRTDVPSAMTASDNESFVDERATPNRSHKAHGAPITSSASVEPVAPDPDRISMTDEPNKEDTADDMTVAVDALKRKRRSASPTPQEDAVKRRRAQQNPPHASLAPAANARNSPGPDKVTSGTQDPREPPVVAIEDAPFDSEPSVEEIGPPCHESTPAIYINNLMRPMREADLRTHLVYLSTAPGGGPNDDAIVKFYVDSIRTHAFVVLDSTSTAVRVRHRLHGRVWPRESNRKALFVDFVPMDKVDDWIDTEESHSREKKTGFRWEVVYQPGRDGNDMVEAVLRSTSVTSSSPATHLTTRAAAGVEGAPTGPRGYRPPAAPPAYPRRLPSDPADPRGRRPSPPPPRPPPPRPQRSPSNAEGVHEQRTMAQPVLYFQQVPPAMAHRRLQDMRGFYNGDGIRQPGNEINRYSFQDGDRFVDRGREVFEGIRPPRRQQALDRERGLVGSSGGRGGGRSGRPPRRGQAPFRPRGDRYVPGPGGPGEDRPPRTAW